MSQAEGQTGMDCPISRARPRWGDCKTGQLHRSLPCSPTSSPVSLLSDACDGAAGGSPNALLVPTPRATPHTTTARSAKWQQTANKEGRDDAAKKDTSAVYVSPWSLESDEEDEATTVNVDDALSLLSALGMGADVGKDGSAPVRPCWECKRCRMLQRKLQTLGAEYETLRMALLQDTSLSRRRQKGYPLNGDLIDQVEQLRITLDTVIRGQLFEIHAAFMSFL